jgi:hypothetical protein
METLAVSTHLCTLYSALTQSIQYIGMLLLLRMHLMYVAQYHLWQLLIIP